jgi:ParB family transcriptional regulator, chromosome partitioning protein
LVWKQKASKPGKAVLTTRRTFPQDIAVDLIEPNPFQARQSFTDIEALAEAIRQQGFTSRLRVRPHPTLPRTFQLVYGERRLLAAKQAGLDVVPCDVADHTDDELIEIGLAENVQRQDLDPLEEARAFLSFIDVRGYSIRRLAERIGKDKSYIEDRLALLRTPTDVQDMVAQRPDSLRAAREIAKLDAPADRQPLIAGVLAGDINSADVREIVSEMAAAPAQRTRSSAAPDAQQIVERDARTLRAILARWACLAPQGSAQHALVSEQTEALLRKVQQLVEQLEQ